MVSSLIQFTNHLLQGNNMAQKQSQQKVESKKLKQLRKKQAQDKRNG